MAPRHLNVNQAVAAAGKNVDKPPYVILVQKLKLPRSTNTPWNQAPPCDPETMGKLYSAMKWDRTAIERECRRVTQTGRADPLIASRQQMCQDIESASHLDTAQKTMMKTDVHNMHCLGFGAEMELSTFQCFFKYTTDSPFFSSHADLIFQNKFVGQAANRDRGQHLTLTHTLQALKLRLQGQMDMRDGDNFFEIKQRMWPEKDMKDKFRWAAHAQILVSLDLT